MLRVSLHQSITQNTSDNLEQAKLFEYLFSPVIKPCFHFKWKVMVVYWTKIPTLAHHRAIITTFILILKREKRENSGRVTDSHTQEKMPCIKIINQNMEKHGDIIGQKYCKHTHVRKNKELMSWHHFLSKTFQTCVHTARNIISVETPLRYVQVVFHIMRRMQEGERWHQ